MHGSHLNSKHIEILFLVQKGPITLANTSQNTVNTMHKEHRLFTVLSVNFPLSSLPQ